MPWLAQDNFDRADENPLAGAWTTVGSNGMQIVSNAVRPIGLSVDAQARYNLISFSDDQWAQGVLGTLGAGSGAGCGPSVRLSSTALTGYHVQCNDSEHRLYSILAGVFTVIGTGAACAVGDFIRLEAQSDNIRVYRNGALSLSVGSTVTTNGSPGLGAFDNIAGQGIIDSWECGDFNFQRGKIAVSNNGIISRPHGVIAS